MKAGLMKMGVNLKKSLFISRHYIALSTKVFLSTTKIPNSKINVDGHYINYEQRGKEGKVVLCLPGSLGTIETDFGPQLKSLHKRNLQTVFWDPPGYGKSRPPQREFPLNFFYSDANFAANLMKGLGYEKYSLLGWSDGGISALIMASKYPKCIEKLVVLGSNAFIFEEELKLYESVRNIDSWSERMRAPMVAVYGKEYFKNTWEKWIDAMIRIYHERAGDICKTEVANITCPTLIIQGKKDAMVIEEHANFLHNNINNSELLMWENGKHNLHLKYAEEFNNVVATFLNKDTIAN